MPVDDNAASCVLLVASKQDPDCCQSQVNKGLPDGQTLHACLQDMTCCTDVADDDRQYTGRYLLDKAAAV